MTDGKAALMILTIALVTALLRFIPFWIFGGRRKTPEVVSYLGRVLPYAIMGMLVIYCLRDTSDPYGLPELLACGAVAALHAWKRSTLLSIAGGTAVYMLLVNFVFV